MAGTVMRDTQERKIAVAETTTVVTPDRFASGLTYKEFLAQAKVNQDKFDENFQTAKVPAEDAASLKKLASMPGGAAKMLVLGEDWCPDVFRGVPILVKIAEAAGMEIRLFPRDQHLDIMNEFLNGGTFQSIPTAVFYTKDTGYIAHWIERPALANVERAQITEQVKKEMPSATDQEVRAEVRKRTTVRYPAWQLETVREIRQLLAKTLGVS